jgi:RecA-family ATPase
MKVRTQIMPSGRVGLVVGSGWSGKSQLLVQLAVSVVTGAPWLGFEVSRPGKVALYSGEEVSGQDGI